MNKTELEAEMRRLAEVAKAKLVREGTVPPTARYYKKGRAPLSQALDLSNLNAKSLERQKIQAAIRARIPDAVIIVSDAWAKIAKKHGDLDLDKIAQDGIAADPERTEVLMLMGGCTEIELCLTVPYSRQEGQIVFEDEQQTENVQNEFFGTAWAERQGQGRVFH